MPFKYLPINTKKLCGSGKKCLLSLVFSNIHHLGIRSIEFLGPMLCLLMGHPVMLFAERAQYICGYMGEGIGTRQAASRTEGLFISVKDIRQNCPREASACGGGWLVDVVPIRSPP